MKKAFTMLELLISITIAGILILAFSQYQLSMDKKNKRKYTKNVFNAIETTTKNVFLDNANYVQKNCIGYKDECSNISLTPQIENGEIVFYTKNEKDLLPVEQLCILTSHSDTRYSFKCLDGFGKPITYQDENAQNLGDNYIIPYQNKYYTLTMKSSYNAKKTFNLQNESEYLKSITLQKIIDISNAIKKFVRNLNLREYANDCSDGGNPDNPSNGLGSWDDAMIPWIWRIVSKNSTQLCTDKNPSDKNACGCDLFQKDSTYWETDSNFCIIQDATTWQRVLNNLGLGNIYRTDGFGNPITISLLSDSNGNPTQCPPPAPKVGYYYPLLFPKARIGIVDNCSKNGGSFSGQCNWYSYVDVYTE